MRWVRTILHRDDGTGYQGYFLDGDLNKSQSEETFPRKLKIPTVEEYERAKKTEERERQKLLIDKKEYSKKLQEIKHAFKTKLEEHQKHMEKAVSKNWTPYYSTRPTHKLNNFLFALYRRLFS